MKPGDGEETELKEMGGGGRRGDVDLISMGTGART